MAAAMRRRQDAVLQPADRGARRRLGREERGRLQVLALRGKGGFDNIIRSIGDGLFPRIVVLSFTVQCRGKSCLASRAFRGQRSRGFKFVGQAPLAAK